MNRLVRHLRRFLGGKISWKILPGCVMMCMSVTLSAQEKSEKKGVWSGDFSLSAGSNFNKPLEEEVGEHYSKYYSRTSGEGYASLKYKAKKFSIDGRLDASSFVYLTGGYGVTVEGTAQEVNRAYGDMSIKETNASAYKGGLSGSWTINQKNSLEGYYQFKFMRDIPQKAVVTVDDILASVDTFRFGYTSEDLDEIRMKHMGGIHYLHSFDKKGRELNVSADFEGQTDDRRTEWNLGDGDMSQSVVTKIYRETPLYYDDVFSFNTKYTDRDFLNVKKLMMEFSMNFKLKADHDRLSAANYINGTWIDSTSYRKNYDFYQSTPRLGIRASYSIGKFSVDAKYQPEGYFYILSSDQFQGTETRGSLAHYADFSASVSPGKDHLISIKFNRDVTRPDYLQICWFDRSGTYANEIIRGNPDLRPSTKSYAGLVYEYSYRRFSLSADVGYTYEFDKIESTFTTEDWEDGTYRINTWINSSKSATMNAALSMSFKGKNLKAEVSGNYNYYVGWKDSGSQTADSDYSLAGNVSYSLKQWLFKVKGRFQSAIIRNYTSTTQIVGLDARIDKKFKRFGLFLEGRDILDQPIEKYTISDDESQKRLEVKNDNRRIFLLGVSYTF